MPFDIPESIADGEEAIALLEKIIAAFRKDADGTVRVTKEEWKAISAGLGQLVLHIGRDFID